MKKSFRCGLRTLLPAALCLLLVSNASVQAQPTISKDHLRSSPKVLQIFREVVANPSKSTVRVFCEGKEVALGAIVEANGYVLTKASVLTGPATCKLKDGRDLPAEVVGVHDPFDLAMLKIDATGLTPITWRPSKDISAGRWVATVGPTADPVAIGVISVPTRGYKPGDQPPKNLGTNSGYLGVSLEEADGGAKIRDIMKGGPADKAGLRIEDVVIQAGPRKVVDMESLINAVQTRKPGEEITLKILRGKDTIEIRATLGRLPKAMAGNPQDRLGSTLSNRRGGFPSILQHDTVLLPTDCGGPLVDLDGKAVGINIARAGRTETYAVPADAVISLLADLKSGKLAPPKETAVEVPQSRPVNDPPLLRVTAQLTAQDPLDKGRGKYFHKVHTVKLSAGVEYTIELTSNDFDAFLRLEDPSGKKLAEDDDGGDDLDARITFRAPEDGTYRVIVTSFEPSETGAYTLNVRHNGSKK